MLIDAKIYAKIYASDREQASTGRRAILTIARKMRWRALAL
jgi:hypothetical protein